MPDVLQGAEHLRFVQRCPIVQNVIGLRTVKTVIPDREIIQEGVGVHDLINVPLYHFRDGGIGIRDAVPHSGHYMPKAILVELADGFIKAHRTKAKVVIMGIGGNDTG